MIDADKVLVRANVLYAAVCPEQDNPRIHSRQVVAVLLALVEALNETPATEDARCQT